MPDGGDLYQNDIEGFVASDASAVSGVVNFDDIAAVSVQVDRLALRICFDSWRRDEVDSPA